MTNYHEPSRDKVTLLLMNTKCENQDSFSGDSGFSTTSHCHNNISNSAVKFQILGCSRELQILKLLFSRTSNL